MAADQQKFSAPEKILLCTFHVVGWVWNVVTFIPWYFISGNFKRPRVGTPQAVSISGRPEGPYRCAESPGTIILGFQGACTLDKLFRQTVQRYGSCQALGTRELLTEEDEIQPNGRVFKKFILGEYKWLSYDSAYDHAKRISSGIQALGVQQKEYVIIFAETKAEWMITAQACFIRNFPVVTIYATLGEDALVYGFNEAEASFVFTDANLLPRMKKLIGQMHYVKTVVFFGDADKAILNDFPDHIQLFSFKQLVDIGSKLKNFEAPFEGPEPDDLAVIMYTSGSTGVPKGVMISHQNMASAIGALAPLIQDLGSDDTYIGYLPLAHVLELSAEIAVLAYGACIGYSSALTLSDQSSKIKRGSKGDVSVLKPTLMAAVPMIMDRIRKNVLEKVGGGPRWLQLLFNFAYDYKLSMVKSGYDTPILNKIVFKKLRAILGGNVRLILSGGAPLSAETEEFMNISFCCPVGQGYGLTETCGGVTLSKWWDTTTGRVGHTVGCAEIKLVSWEEGNYTTEDKPYPRGEVVIGGNSVTLGYLKQEEKTRECFIHEDGGNWFYTGDIGEMHDDGVLRIIDRKKDLVKLSHGEYVSLGKVEAALKHSKYVENSCVYGSSKETYVIVLIVPAQQHLMELAAAQGIQEPFENLCSNKNIVDIIKKDIQSVCLAGKLHKSETPQKLKLCCEQWTPESEMVTAAFKLKRKNIERFYERDIAQMYAN